MLLPTHKVSENNSYPTGSLRIIECSWNLQCYVSINNGLWFKWEIWILRQIRNLNKTTIILICQCLCIYEFNTWDSVIIYLSLFLEFMQRSRIWRHFKAMRKLPMFSGYFSLDLRCKENCLQTVALLSLSSCLFWKFQVYSQRMQCNLGIKSPFWG